jgi:hypothetical protein
MSLITDPHIPNPADRAGMPALDDAQRVDNLISQLEARTMALVPYGYGQVPMAPPPTSWTTPVIAGSLVAIWLSSLILAVLFFQSRSERAQIVERSTVAPLVIPTSADVREQKVNSSMDRLAKALVSSSERLRKLETVVEKSTADARQRTTATNAERTKEARADAEARMVELAAHHPPPPQVPAPVVTSVAASIPVPVVVPGPPPMKPPVAPLVTAPLPAQVAPPVIPVVSGPKGVYEVLKIKPTDAATPHQGPDGKIDYWLVARHDINGLVKVLPINKSSDGVVVRDLDDGKNYVLTPQGEWRPAEW